MSKQEQVEVVFWWNSPGAPITLDSKLHRGEEVKEVIGGIEQTFVKAGDKLHEVRKAAQEEGWVETSQGEGLIFQQTYNHEDITRVLRFVRMRT